jgi:diadenosine tetraphosphate (Ap4A) HIT family hydrolase
MALTNNPASAANCSLCRGEDGGTLVWRDDFCRVVLVDDADYPGFCRVILNAHQRELSDLLPAEQSRLLQVVVTIETTLRATLQPDKINLASLGNQVPHLHWHLIPRYVDDAHFPQPIWGTRQRESNAAQLTTRHQHLPALLNHLQQALNCRSW